MSLIIVYLSMLWFIILFVFQTGRLGLQDRNYDVSKRRDSESLYSNNQILFSFACQQYMRNVRFLKIT